ncbi:hypothetical protein B0A48_10935 [Cryoendolithus antarcticus]|uniref:Uncharacterized protein n=1 Tax=Cryoendolithus antarcticus TaxID=1507870 RepID=A0A1V8SZ20_9PEZI|nr:hypothetical protein B0A48_10935 [Cryoendolithus antarcticus]
MPPPTQYNPLAPPSHDPDGPNDDSDLEDDGTYEDEPSNPVPRTSTERRHYDRDTLEQEDEAERLLARASSKPKRKRKRIREMKMEEGGKGSDSGSSAGSAAGSEVDLSRLGDGRAGRARKSWRRRAAFLGLYAAIVAAFLGLLYGAYKATKDHDRMRTRYRPQVMSNGSSLFAPTTILLSLDGFRADFLHRNLTPTLNAFIREGVSPKYMLPSFPSVTFPNHFTLVTGLYPESHGIVGNTFWDPALQRQFHYTDAARSMQPEWWNAEPIWETAELAGVRTAIHMWLGSEAHIGAIEPMYVDKYNADEELDRKVDRILGWLDLPSHLDQPKSTNTEIRPQLLAAYVPNVDADGHKYGPNSTEIRSTIADVDRMLSKIFTGIASRNLTSIVNVVVVSDHGMATTDTARLIQLEDLLDTTLIEHIDGWPLYGLRPHDTSAVHLAELHKTLLAASLTSEHRGKFTVHLRSDMPARFHFSNNPRIAPLWLIPTTGYAIVTHKEMDVALAQTGGLVYHPRGLHGYDHEHPLMRAIFVARGPAFPHEAGSEVKVFQNTEVYGIVCDSLGIAHGKIGNNGTLSLPFKTIGLHEGSGGPGQNLDDETGEVLESDKVIPAIAPFPIFSSLPPLEDADEVASVSTEHEVFWTTDAQGSLVTGVPDAGDESGDKAEKGDQDGFEQNLNYKLGWIDWFKGKVEGAKDWVKGVFHKGGEEEETDEVSGSRRS